METKHLETKRQKNTNSKNRSQKLVNFHDIQKVSRMLKAQGKKIVFTLGDYDLLNPGHCRFLAEAKSKGDILVVGVSTYFSVSKTKGDDFPLTREDLRAELLSCLRVVDFIISTDELNPHTVLFLLQPDVYFVSAKTPENYQDDQIKFVVDSYGGTIYERELERPYFGTASLVEHMADIRFMQILSGYLKEKTGDIVIKSESFLKPADYGLQTPMFDNALNANKLLIKFDDLPQVRKRIKKLTKKVVFVAGSYDVLHVGHARFIEQAALLGDVLIVGIPSDKSLRALKGIGRPIISEHSRAYVLGHLDYVDYVTIFDDWTVRSTLQKLKPDIFFTVDEEWNKDYKKSAEYKIVKKYGGKIARIKRQAPYLSSSTIIDKLANRKVKEIFKECMDETRFQKLLMESSKLTKV